MINKRKKDKFGNGLIAFLFICIIFLLCYAFKNPVLLYSSNPEVEINHEYDPKENIQQVFFHSDSEVKISGDIDTNKIGNYEITYQLKNYKKICKVSVKDTKAPELKVKAYKADMKEDVKPESFVESVNDDSKVSLSFKKKPTKDKEQTLTIIAKDAYGNTTTKETTLALSKDTKKPVIHTDSISVYVGSKPNYKSYIEVTDNLDSKPTIKVDSSKVKTKKTGTYKLLVTATDRSGNKAKAKINVTVEEPSKVVYMTFDDGPSENTDKILKILKKYDAKATFFVTGNNQKYNSSIKKAADQGNTIALHTYTHDYANVYSSTTAYFEDLQKVSDMVKQITGKAPKYIRFPGGSSNTISAQFSQGIMTTLDSLVHEKGYEYFDWNCSSGDAASNTVPAQDIVHNATSCDYEQIMILFHDSSPKTTTVEALPEIIKSYKERGYVFKGICDDTPIFHHGVNN